jgi:beta-xylosidase
MLATSLLTLFTSLLPLISAQNSSAGATFTNPVLNQVGADPFVAKDGGYYYLTYTTATNITILKSTSLTDWDNAEAKLAFDPPVCFLSFLVVDLH